ncbi:MAG: sigma 54-interacting transcriptional regulator, partial [Deltaproteobacteria bacterium]|nr:sigma 54-interacting transcriptional regulator [Deltaproteobacteria bacterium]MBW2535128.1 sigma 54-interacting transcriptional regulator [Deltaproteobacteria bacterium]
MSPRDDPSDATQTSPARPSSQLLVEPGRLRVVYPIALAATIELPRAKLTLGRQPTAARGARLSHPTVSRQHVAVEWSSAAAEPRVRDLGSHNGSWLNGEPVGSAAVPLGDHDVLRVGDVLLTYEQDAAGEADDSRSVSRDAVPGAATATRRLRGQIARAAADPSAALIVGETGTGKEFVARELHRLSGREGPFLPVNCAALSPQLFESQLFGHAKGAFTGAQVAEQGLFRAADGGTLLLDEVGELPASLQPKLLRVLQEREVLGVGETRPVRVDVRVVASTLRDLVADAQQGSFRLDLYARLSLWELRVPPLRWRRADLLGWLDRLVARWFAERGQQPRDLGALSPEAAELLLLHPWPDNLRGLDRVVHRWCTEPHSGELAGEQ